MLGLRTVVLLTLANVFMTFAWYAHLRKLSDKPWWIAVFVSWGIALLEYLLQVPANRDGHRIFTVAQLKIMQEVITLAVFVPFLVFYMKEKPTWNFAAAGGCMVAAVWFMFRK